ncbi:barstar family protein [Actinomadura sp. WMMB 499]|uniref:barstar family protein n=1 Tax=Actinomadura sp. WMMB 499 TaxID=1219491 RepID=UPI00159D470A|nr:barstar family protein [Actinomadura sp. WMMB 499]
MAKYRLIAEDRYGLEEGVLCSFDEITGFFTGALEDDMAERFEVDVLIPSYSPGEYMAALLPDGGKAIDNVSSLEVLGRDDTVLGVYHLMPSTTRLVPEGLRCSFTTPGHRPFPEEEELWDMWRAGRPQTSGVWAQYGDRGRRAWLDVARQRHVRTNGADRPDGSTFELDGTHVTDSAGFFCALGEAINGPGGYYGKNLIAVDDCMSGGYGTAGGFTLIWHDLDVARRSWKPRLPYDPYYDPSLDRVLDRLAQFGVTVERR